ncbi:HNH endonuclease [Pseudomonas viridiflava]|uniref:HNH endonuclease n=1 Tax=Pseudomonas viridiflava TaxID=33069 RepID=UPI002EB5A28C|nr:HNH endonuclease [Pseudomonas viridiflava]
MINLSNTETKILLRKILDLVNSNLITTTEAWKLFSHAKQTEVLTAVGLTISNDDINNLTDLKRKVVKELKSHSGKRCAYCRRPMGTHALSWHIEHIKPKSKFRELMFSMQNLVYACIDCNFTKNSQIDNKREYVFDIINPKSKNFKYSEHLSYYQITTDQLHLIKYEPTSESGKQTYKRLFLAKIESLEIVSGLNSDIRDLANRVDEAVEQLDISQDAKDLAEFLTKLKLEMAMPKQN